MNGLINVPDMYYITFTHSGISKLQDIASVNDYGTKSATLPPALPVPTALPPALPTLKALCFEVIRRSFQSDALQWMAIGHHDAFDNAKNEAWEAFGYSSLGGNSNVQCHAEHLQRDHCDSFMTPGDRKLQWSWIGGRWYYFCSNNCCRTDAMIKRAREGFKY
jgi:hypothetical protein